VFPQDLGLPVFICYCEGGYSGCAVLTVIICKLCEWEQAGPVVLLVIDEDPQVGLQGLILSLYLPICLWVECGTQVSLLLNDCADFCPHPAYEDGASV
jgi:hypothetical protein